MIQKKYFIILTLLACAAALQSCSSNNKAQADGSDSTAVAETLAVLVDRPLEEIMRQQELSFRNLYNNPVLSLSAYDEQELINLLIADSARCAILSRKLNAAEIAQIAAVNEVEPKQYVIAHDAIALIAASSYPADSISTWLLAQIASGKVKDKGQLVFENAASGSVSYMLNELGIKQVNNGNIFAQRSADSLAAFLRSNNNSIGVIPYSYISEQANPEMKTYMSGLKILAVTYPDRSGRLYTVKPSQESITTEEYPFSKPVVLVTGNMKQQSGTVFVNFLHKDRAQRIFLKSGIVPDKFPTREIKIDRTPINATQQK